MGVVDVQNMSTFHDFWFERARLAAMQECGLFTMSDKNVRPFVGIGLVDVQKLGRFTTSTLCGDWRGRSHEKLTKILFF